MSDVRGGGGIFSSGSHVKKAYLRHVTHRKQTLDENNFRRGGIEYVDGLSEIKMQETLSLLKQKMIRQRGEIIDRQS